jgi:hypothetical protein
MPFEVKTEVMTTLPCAAVAGRSTCSEATGIVGGCGEDQSREEHVSG